MRYIGGTSIRALSVASAYGDLREDWDKLTDKEKLWIDVIPWIIVAAAVIFLIWTILLGGSAVHVNARTEHLVYTPLYSDPPVWLLKDTVFENTDLDALVDNSLFGNDNESAARERNFLKTVVGAGNSYLVNGFLQLSCGDRVVVSRIGNGSIKVDVDAVRDVIVTDDVGNGVVFVTKKNSNAEEPEIALGRSFSFYPHSMLSDSGEPSTEKLGESVENTSYVWPMEGQIIPSRAVGVDTVTTQGLLLSGHVELLNRRVMSNSNYTVATHELELGDHLVLATSEETEKKRYTIIQEWAIRNNENNRQTTASANSRLPWTPDNCEDLQPSVESFGLRPPRASETDKGFLHIDEEKGMAISLVSSSGFVDIKRYRSTAIRLQSNAVSRLQNDRLFSLGWSVILFGFLAYRKFARAYVVSRARQDRTPTIDFREPGQQGSDSSSVHPHEQQRQ
ncbi:MAG: hypothetical protein AB8B63_03310 [Granulosicoccus sp.]